MISSGSPTVSQTATHVDRIGLQQHNCGALNLLIVVYAYGLECVFPAPAV
jgi:hypothetical protein